MSASPPPAGSGCATPDALELEPHTALTIRLEQALLGELLHQALAADGLTTAPPLPPPEPELRPDDLLRPYHQQVYEAICHLAGDGRAATPHAVLHELHRDTDLPSYRAMDALPLTDLLAAACGPRRLTTVMNLLLEASARRQISRWSVRLAQLQATKPSSASAGPTLIDRDALIIHLRTLRHDIRVWQQRLRHLSPGHQGRHPPHQDDLDGAPGPDRSPRPLTPSPTADDTRRYTPPGAHSRSELHCETGAAIDVEGLGLEVQLLASIATHPWQIDDLRRWLEPRHFQHPDAARLYAIALHHHDQQQAVDPFTLAWQASLFGLHIPADQPLVEALAGGLPWGRHLAVRLHTLALRRTMQSTARQVAWLAEQPTNVLAAVTAIDHLLEQLIVETMFARPHDSAPSNTVTTLSRSAAGQASPGDGSWSQAA